MSDEPFHSRRGYFSGTIPQGWFSSSDTSVAQSLEVWLLSDDLSAAIIIRELHLDERSRQQVQSEGLEYLAERSKSFFETNSSKIFQQQIEFSIGQMKLYSYEVAVDSLTKRIVVFTNNHHFFECEATPVNKHFDIKQLQKLFSLQQSVLTSLIFRTYLP